MPFVLDIDRQSVIDITEQSAGNDEIITVPAGHIYVPNFIAIRLVTDVTVGNRQLTIEARDPGNNIVYTADAAATQAASLDIIYYAHAAGDPLLPEMSIPEGGDLHFFLSAAGAPGDDITLRGWVLAAA